MVRLLLLFTALFSALFIVSCNAPHENPLDPENPDNSLYYIEGTIFSAEASSKPVAELAVLWKPGNTSVYTNSSGYFKINCENLTDGYLVLSKAGFNTDSIKVTWGKDKIKSMNLLVNYLPVLDSVYSYSSIKNKFSAPEKQIIIEAYASDRDNDIDTLYIYNSALAIDKPLQKISSKYFEGRFNDYDLGLNSIEQLIGKRLEVYALTGGKRVHVGNTFIRRVITQEIETLSPVNSDTISTKTPSLNWKRFEPGFAFSYMIEVYTDETEPKLLFKKDNISSDEISLNLIQAINPTADNNRFFWVIYSLDEYKDRSRSKPAGFVIISK